MTLHLYSTRYARGAVIKLAKSIVDPDPAAKFVVQRHEGGFELKQAMVNASDPLRRGGLVDVAFFDNEPAAIEAAERECERIRLSLGGGRGRG